MAVGRTELIEEVEEQLDGITIADHEFKALLQDIDTEEKRCKRMKEYIDNQESKIEILKENLKGLERENEKLRPAFEDIERKTCASQDARKMFGDVVPGDATHKDVTLSFKDYFKKAFRNLPKSLEESAEEGKHKIWEMTCDIVQDCFKHNKDEIVEEMMKELETALLNPPLPNKSIDDKTADLYKAFYVFVVEVMSKKGPSCGIGKRIKNDLKQKLLSQDWHKRYLADDIDLATDILTKLDPEDYFSIIDKGEKREKSYYSGSERKESICFACKKCIEVDKNDFPIQHLGVYWHKHHYNCHRCHKVIDCENFVYIKDQDTIYCRSCSCVKCQYPISKEYFQDEDGLVYHPACALCQYCRTTGNIKLEHICIKCGQKQ